MGKSGSSAPEYTLGAALGSSGEARDDRAIAYNAWTPEVEQVRSGDFLWVARRLKGLVPRTRL